MHVLEFPTNTILVLLRNNVNFLFCAVKDLIFKIAFRLSELWKNGP